MDIEGAAHVVHGEDDEELTLHVGDGNGLDGELLLALDGDFVGGGVGPQPHLRLGTVILRDTYVKLGELRIVIQSDDCALGRCWTAANRYVIGKRHGRHGLT